MLPRGLEVVMESGAIDNLITIPDTPEHLSTPTVIQCFQCQSLAHVHPQCPEYICPFCQRAAPDATGYQWRPPSAGTEWGLGDVSRSRRRAALEWRLGASVSPVAVLLNQGSTQVNSTGVYRAMYWAIYTVQGRARTMLCYCYRRMAKEELGKGLPATNGKRCAYQRVQSGNERKRSPTQPLGQRAMTS